MNPSILRYRQSEISYYRFGNGGIPVICFHGYGENALTFNFLGDLSGHSHSFIAIDLPFHGLTKWMEADVTPGDLVVIVEEILQKEKFFPLSEKMMVMGFSLGGRMSLQLYQSKPEWFNRILLLAPDGMKVNFWYWLATQSFPGNKLFALTMKKPGWFFGMLKVLNKTGLVNASIFKFVNYYIADKNIRQLLYDRWTKLRRIKPSMATIRSLCRKNKTIIKILYGKHDRIILPPAGKRFQKGVEDLCEIKIINSGHQVLNPKYADDILLLLNGD